MNRVSIEHDQAQTAPELLLESCQTFDWCNRGHSSSELLADQATHCGWIRVGEFDHGRERGVYVWHTPDDGLQFSVDQREEWWIKGSNISSDIAREIDFLRAAESAIRVAVKSSPEVTR